MYPLIALLVAGLVVALASRLPGDPGREGDIVIFHNNLPGELDLQVSGVHFQRCGAPPHFNCVIDGDTFYHRDQSIRLAGIDAPEINPPECAREYELGEAASERLVELLNDGPFEIRYASGDDEDQYGRELRVLNRGDAEFGTILQREGLARQWAGRHLSWCE